MTIRRMKDILLMPHVIFLIIASAIGWLFLLINPPIWGLDEPAHFARVYHIAKGDIIPNTSKENYGGSMPDNFFTLNWYRGADMLDEKFSTGTSVLQRQDVTDRGAYAAILNEKFSKNESNFPWTAMYAPITYPGPLLGVYISNSLDLTIGQTFFIAGLLSLLVYIGVCFSTLWLLRKTKLVWLFLVVSLLPTSIFQATVVTSDSILISLSLLFFALWARLFVSNNSAKVKKYILVILLLIGVVLPIIKINYAILSLSLLLLPGAVFGLKKWHTFYKVCVLFGSIVPAVIWSKLSGASGVPPQSQRQDLLPVNPAEQIQFILLHPLDFIVAFVKSIVIYGDDTLYGIFFTISGIGVDVPLALMFALIVALIATGLYAKSDLLKFKKQIIYMVTVSLLLSISIYAALYAVFNPVGWWFIDGVQGRYFTPLILPLAMLIVLYLPIKITASRKALLVSSVAIISLCLMTSVLYTFIAYY